MDVALLVLVAARVWDLDATTTLRNIDLEAARRCVEAADRAGGGDPIRGASALLMAIVQQRPFYRDNEVMALIATAQFLAEVEVAATFEPGEPLRDLLARIRSGDASHEDVIGHVLAHTNPHKEKAAMFERFTPRARQAIAEAKRAAQELQDNFMGTEHLLLGLLAIEDGIGTQVLRDLGVDAGEVKRQVQNRRDSGPKAVVDHFPFTPRSKQALELSLRHALSLGDDYIGTEHMLLGLLEAPDGLARQILEEMGVTLAVAHERVTTALVAQGWTPPPKRPRRRLRLRGYPGVIGQPTSTPMEVRNRRLLTELTAIISENDTLRSEVSRLRHLLAEHQIDPGQSASGEKPA